MSQTLQYISDHHPAWLNASLDSFDVSHLDGSIHQLRLVVDNLHSTLDELSTKHTPATQVSGLLDALPACLLVLDRQGRVLDSNAAAAALMGADLQGRQWRDLLRQYFQSAVVGGELQTQDGRYFTLATQALNGDGQIVLLQDVTETHTLRQLLERRSRLEVVGDMVTRLAHQLATPLSTLRLAFEQTSGQSTQEAWFADADAAVTRLMGLVQELQLFVHGGAAVHDIISVQQLIADLQAQSQSQMQAAGARLLIGILPDVHVRINRVAMLSALQNLIDNALHAQPNGLLLKIEAECDAQQLRLRVSDNGPGISPQISKRLFEPFFTTRAEGTGLGLAVARSVAQACGGRLSLMPAVDGCGCSFLFELPLALAKDGIL